MTTLTITILILVISGASALTFAYLAKEVFKKPPEQRLLLSWAVYTGMATISVISFMLGLLMLILP